MKEMRRKRKINCNHKDDDQKIRELNRQTLKMTINKLFRSQK